MVNPDTQKPELIVISDPEHIATLARRICQLHTLDDSSLTRIHGGVHSTYRTADPCFLKLFTFSRTLPYSMRKESQVLKSLGKHTRVPVPIVLETGEMDGIPYMVLSELGGIPLARALDNLGQDEGRELLRHFGQTLRTFHEHRPDPQECPDLDDYPFSSERWSSELGHRKSAVLGKFGEDLGRWANSLDVFLDASLSIVGPVLLHADLRSDHMLVADTKDGWRVTGVIDVPKVMMGSPEYDLAMVPLCTGVSRETALIDVLSGYGYPAEIDDTFVLRLLAHYILGPRGMSGHWLESFGDGITPGDYAKVARTFFFGKNRAASAN